MARQLTTPRLHLLLLFVPVRAWVLYSTSSTEDRIYRWDAPADSTLDSGLGGGLTWALQDSFCEAVLPRFYAERQGNLVDCEAIVDAIVRGFGTWAANHRRLAFHDITDACTGAAPLFVPNETTTREELGVAMEAECGGLEISLTAGPPLVDNHSSRAAVVYNMPADRTHWQSGTRSTAGDVEARSRAIERSRVHFNTNLCWYLDNSFCYGFHRMAADGLAVQGLARAVVGISFCASLVAAGAFAAWLVRRLRARGREGAFEAIEALAMWQTPVVLFLLTAPLLWYYNIFRPCWDCYDFEAAVAHEIGHALGFDHPDALPWRNLNATAPMSAATCHDPFVAVEPAPFVSAGGDEQLSIMLSLTKQRARACLSDDDLMGLNFVYPTCNDDLVKHAPPACVKSKRNVGALRFVVVVTLPFMTSFVILVLLVGFAKRRQTSRFKRIQTSLQAILGKHVRAISHSQVPGRPGSTRRLVSRRASSTVNMFRLSRATSGNIFGAGRRASIPIDALAAVAPSQAPGPSAASQTQGLSGAAPAAALDEETFRRSSKQRLRFPMRSSRDQASSSSCSSVPQLRKIDSRVAGSATALDRQLQHLHAHKEASEAKVEASNLQWQRGNKRLRASLAVAAANISDESLRSCSLSSGGNSTEQSLAGKEEVAALLERFWKLFEPVILMQAAEDGRIEEWQQRLLPTAQALVAFPQEQLAQLQAARPDDTAAPLARRTHLARKAWFERLLGLEPALFDWYMSLDDGNARAAASLLLGLADFSVDAAQHGPRNPLNHNRTNRALKGLSLAPLIAERWRGLLVEWILLQRKDGKVQPKGPLDVLRQFLLALRLDDAAGSTAGR